MGIAGTGIIERWRSHLWRWWPITVIVRLIVALFLAVGPATDAPSELAGWDAERFQEIAERDGAAWVDHPVEYPPGSVVVFDRLAGADVVDTHRRLVLLSLLLDLGLAVAIRRRVGRDQATAYLWLGLPLVPFGYQRLDTLVTTVAVIGALAILAGDRDRRSPMADGLAATAIAVGTMLKLWPLLLVVGAVALGRWRAAVGAVSLTALAGVAWLVATGDGVGPLDQVLSLRGATGWHVESLPGSLVALLGSGPADLELNAYRIGTLRPALVTVGRAVAVAVMGGLAFLGWRWTRGQRSGDGDRERVVLSVAVLGSVAALLVTAPLLSPQFLVWLVPFAALAIPNQTLVDRQPSPERAMPAAGPAVVLVASAAVLTGVAIHGFGPAGLTGTLPAGLLTARNLTLIAMVVACLAALRAAPVRR